MIMMMMMMIYILRIRIALFYFLTLRLQGQTCLSTVCSFLTVCCKVCKLLPGKEIGKGLLTDTVKKRDKLILIKHLLDLILMHILTRFLFYKLLPLFTVHYSLFIVFAHKYCHYIFFNCFLVYILCFDLMKCHIIQQY